MVDDDSVGIDQYESDCDCDGDDEGGDHESGRGDRMHVMLIRCRGVDEYDYTGGDEDAVVSAGNGSWVFYKKVGGW